MASFAIVVVAVCITVLALVILKKADSSWIDLDWKLGRSTFRFGAGPAKPKDDGDA